LVERINSGVAEAPNCVTVMVFAVTPVPLIVIVAVRAVAAVLAAAVTVTVALFVPEAVETVSHVGALLLTVHAVLDVTVNDCCCPVAAKLMEAVDSVSAGVCPFCTTVMVWAGRSDTLTVIIAVRSAVVGLAITVTVISSSPDPEVLLKVSHAALLLTVQ